MKSTKKPLIHPVVVMAAADITPIKSILGTTKGKWRLLSRTRGDYYKGKKGYIITWGTANKHDLPHQFCSDVDENSRDSALADAAVKEKLDRFKPIAFAYLSDMRYESSGWTYTTRIKPVRHQKDLSAIVDECKDVNFIPLNTRLDDFEYKNNKSTLFWKEGVTNAQPGDKIKTSSGRVIELQQAVPIPHDVPDRRIETW